MCLYFQQSGVDYSIIAFQIIVQVLRDIDDIPKNIRAVNPGLVSKTESFCTWNVRPRHIGKANTRKI